MGMLGGDEGQEGLKRGVVWTRVGGQGVGHAGGTWRSCLVQAWVEGAAPLATAFNISHPPPHCNRPRHPLTLPSSASNSCNRSPPASPAHSIHYSSTLPPFLLHPQIFNSCIPCPLHPKHLASHPTSLCILNSSPMKWQRPPPRSCPAWPLEIAAWFTSFRPHFPLLPLPRSVYSQNGQGSCLDHVPHGLLKKLSCSRSHTLLPSPSVPSLAPTVYPRNGKGCRRDYVPHGPRGDPPHGRHGSHHERAGGGGWQ